MGKKVLQLYHKLEIPAGAANPSPPVGPALGQRGLNIMEFCKAFNAATQNLEPGMPIPCVITAYADRTFSFITKTPPASFLIRKAAGLQKAANNPGHEQVGTITVAQAKEIAETKMQDLNAVDMEGAVMMVKGTARSMGIEVTE